MKKADFDTHKEELDNQISQLQHYGMNTLDIFSLRVQLSRCIMPPDLKRLQKSIDVKKETIELLSYTTAR